MLVRMKTVMKIGSVKNNKNPYTRRESFTTSKT